VSESGSFPFGQDIAWQPAPADVERSNLAAFWRAQGLSSYAELQSWALADVGRFWDAALRDLGVEFQTPYSRIIDTSAGGIQRPAWCVGGEMNVVHNCLDKWLDSSAADRDAVRYESEEGDARVLTYRELHDQVAACAAGLRARGIGRGDVVGLFMPMTPELVIAFLAVARIGAVILPLFSGYGAPAVASRLQDAGARALFVSDGAPRRGRSVAMKAVADEALAECPTVELVFVHDRAGLAPAMISGRDVAWEDLLASGRGGNGATERTSTEAPVMIIYTSGTTGRPKGALHTHCGFPIKAAQDMRHAMDVRAGDVVWWMSDMGWMMGPWLVFGALLNGATMVLYDGAPDFPDPARTWAICERQGVTLLGLSPSLVRALMPQGQELPRRHDLSALRACGSTGSPWDPESWRWLFEHVLESRKPILNYSGGTEISGGILCGNFVEPVKPGGFPGAVVGMDADVVDDAGRPIRGAVGELILRQPWIGMTRGFWRDESGERYHDAYWAKTPGLWVHGDFAVIDDDGQWFILGRSDDTIKVAGKRLGPSEVEAILDAHPSVLESAAIGVPDDVKGEALVAFAVPAPGVDASEALRADLAGAVVASLGKALAPKALYFVDALPRTRNAKVMRRVVRAAHLGTDPGDVSSLERPEAVDAVRDAR